VKITAIRLDRMRLPLDPPFYAAWDPMPRRHFDATLVRVETDEGVTGYGSGDTMDRTDWVSSLEAVRATRVAVGEDIAIMADLNQWWRMAGDLSPALDETQVPDAPGLGASIDHAAVARYALS